ncbi:MAG: FecR family protein [Bacteroidales bacterium]|nr:FecR family protein [Bacteroidales bacterium]
MDKNLLIKYLHGECDAQESLEIAILFELVPEIKNEFEALKAEWQAVTIRNDPPQTLEIEAELEKYMLKIDGLRKQERSDTRFLKPSKIDLKLIFKIAALVIIGIGLGSLITYRTISVSNQRFESGNLTHLVMSPKGSNTISILPDGTKVWLNAGTTLKYSNKYGIQNRDVELEGEAYFKVTTDPEMPFTVFTSELKIKAWGTAFNVKAYPDEKVITTTLEEGKVSIQGRGINIILKPKQNVTYQRREFIKSDSTADNTYGTNKPKTPDPIARKPKFDLLTDVNTQIYTSWKDGQWIIESETLSEVATLMERKFSVTVQIESEGLLDYRFSGTFTNETLEQILNAFRLTAPIEYKIDKGIVTIKQDKKRKENYLDIIHN